MSNIILKATNISKQYRLGLIGTGTISHDLNRWWSRIRGKEDPFLKVGDVNDRSTKGSSDYVWALKDINFEVKQGEVLGIIGKNGAGKSTILKILSRVTTPTTGEIKTKGRIASLLEVGTGFHPELTGRENIYLNGAILGMTKTEIKTKEDEIIDFSGCLRYIDTPVKRYSSGMRVRLAFAVAAFLEPDILVIDEVLAVGDIEFQKKAIGKMQDISQSDGRTVLFVSHNMAAVEKLCNRALLIEDGKISFRGTTQDTINTYRQILDYKNKNFNFSNRNRKNSKVNFTSFKMISILGESKNKFLIDEGLIFQTTISSELEVKVSLRIAIFDKNERRLLAFDSINNSVFFILTQGSNIIKCCLPEGLEIKPDEYLVNISLRNKDILYDHIINVSKFTIEVSDYYKSGRITNSDLPIILKKNKWDFINE